MFVGGASEGLLQVGDRILSVNNSNAQSISHFEAQHLFKSVGAKRFFKNKMVDISEAAGPV